MILRGQAARRARDEPLPPTAAAVEPLGAEADPEW
jgi:hypothetical protein